MRKWSNILEEKNADAIVGAIEFPLSEASRFGVISVDENRRILRFDEKPAQPTPMPHDSDACLRLDGHLLVSRPPPIRERLIEDVE